MKNRGSRRGFTIVELLVVIAVIAILAAVMMPTFTQLTKSARDTADKQTMRAINKMLAVGEIEAEEIKQYKLRNEEWELAYSHSDNEAVIVDKSGRIVAANNEEFVGAMIGAEYVLALAIEEETGGNDNSGEENNPINPHEETWGSATHVESDLSSLKEELNEEKELYICDSVTSIPQSYFSYDENFKCNDKLERIYIGEGIKEISVSTFEGCAKLKEVYIAGDGIEIGPNAFYGCSELERINLDKVKSIGLRAFANCSKLTNVTLNSLESMDKYVFKGSGVKEIELSKSLNTMHNYSMNGCTLEKLTIKSGVEVQDVYESGLDVTVQELVIGGEEWIEVSESLWYYISNVIAKSEGILTSVTIKNITVGESLSGIKPFNGLSNNVQIMIADNESYIGILGGRSESEVFGGNELNIIKQWL